MDVNMIALQYLDRMHRANCALVYKAMTAGSENEILYALEGYRNEAAKLQNEFANAIHFAAEHRLNNTKP